MSYQDSLKRAASELSMALQLVQDEIRDYPTPISGCDAQFNHLIGVRGSINEAMRAISTPHFVATPRSPEPGAGIESR